MKIIDILKKFLGIKEKLYLPIPENIQNTHRNNAQKFRQRYDIKRLPQNPKEPALEDCITEFIKQYQLQENINFDNKNKSYKAFRRMFCDQEEEMRK